MSVMPRAVSERTAQAVDRLEQRQRDEADRRTEDQDDPGLDQGHERLQPSLHLAPIGPRHVLEHLRQPTAPLTGRDQIDG